VEQDLGLATNVSKALGSPVPLAEAAEKVYEDSVRRYPELSKRDFSSIYRYLEGAMKEGRRIDSVVE
jgi:3-hydroxyisobutyrate dehydrogenase